MGRTTDLPLNGHLGVGPYPDVGDHGPVTVLSPNDGKGAIAWVCLDCGLCDDDRRRFTTVECDRERNPINQTWRERIEAEGFPEGEQAGPAG